MHVCVPSVRAAFRVYACVDTMRVCVRIIENFRRVYTCAWARVRACVSVRVCVCVCVRACVRACRVGTRRCVGVLLPCVRGLPTQTQ